MSDQPALVYLEADDEITSLVRRVRAADAERVVVVAPGRSRATSSATALRLLARAASDARSRVAVVGDALTRSLAVEAGLEAYASVDDAKAAREPASTTAEPKHAAIHVVRGPASAEDAPTVAAMPAVADAETRPIRLQPRRQPPPRRTRPGRPTRHPVSTARGGRRVAIPLLVAAAVLLAGTAYVAAAVLPAATIRITPRTDVVGPVEITLEIDDATPTRGTAEGTATVTATGTYPIEVAAGGAVVFYNFNFFPVTVPAGSLVAAGRQAYATQAEIVVPRGRIIPTGQIQAGQESVAVVAAAPGPDGNVGAGAIDTVLDPTLDAQLQAYAENGQRRVENLEPTSGGLLDTGVEITQQDVDAAMAELREALATKVGQALEPTESELHADAAEVPEPEIKGLKDLVGTRDQETVQISGTLTYDRLSVGEDEVRARAIERFERESAELVPSGSELLSDATTVEIGEVARDGEVLRVDVTVTGRSTRRFERSELLDRVKGRSKADAVAALEPFGTAEVELWPGWVTTVPDAEWRITIEGDDGSLPSIVPSGSP